MEQINQSKYTGVGPLVLGILAIILPVVGFVLGIIGVFISRKSFKNINPDNLSAKWMSIAGLICSIIGICLQFLSILGMAVFFYAAQYGSFGP